MATVRRDFDSYKMWYYAPGFGYEALIYLYKAGAYVGRITFHKDGEPTPKVSMDAPFGTPQPAVHFPLSRLNDVIEMLRYEKPLYLFINPDVTYNVGIIGTDAMEPVGEQEGT